MGQGMVPASGRAARRRADRRRREEERAWAARSGPVTVRKIDACEFIVDFEGTECGAEGEGYVTVRHPIAGNHTWQRFWACCEHMGPLMQDLYAEGFEFAPEHHIT